MCCAFNRQYKTQYIAAMPLTLYGPNDNYDLSTSHVLPALLRKSAMRRLTVQRKWLFGGPALRGANFCTAMIWQTPVSF